MGPDAWAEALALSHVRDGLLECRCYRDPFLKLRRDDEQLIGLCQQLELRDGRVVPSFAERSNADQVVRRFTVR